jgi:hypothetical protein
MLPPGRAALIAATTSATSRCAAVGLGPDAVAVELDVVDVVDDEARAPPHPARQRHAHVRVAHTGPC